MRILLISLQNDLHTIGLKYLHYYLLKNGYNSSILYLPNFNPTDKNQLERIKKFTLEMNPAFIGISLMSTEYHGACHLTKYLKTFVKSMPIIWGGIHPTISPEDCLNFADYACIGEGERTILDIAKAIGRMDSIKPVNNLCYLENGQIKRNPLYPLAENLDDLSTYEQIPRNSFILTKRRILELDGHIFERYDRYLGRAYSIATSRGCAFSCTFCCNNFISRLYQSSKIRRRSVGNIIDELKKGTKDNSRIEYVFFMDDCFLACGEGYLKEFCELYKREIKKPFMILSIPVYITRNKLEALKDAGLVWVNLGLQSGSDRVCREIYKRRSFKSDFLNAAKIINELGMAAYYDLILDNPFENEKDKFETIQTLGEIPRPFYMDFYSLTFYYGTELYEKAKSEYPEYVEDCREKDYLVPQRDDMNKLIRIAAFIDTGTMARLMRLYRQDPKGIAFRISLFIAYLLTLFMLEPITYFRVIRLSQRGSYLKTFKVLSVYFRLGIMRYAGQFKDKSDAAPSAIQEIRKP